MSKSSPQSFKTTDTALAAWLYSSGNVPINIETDNGITVFCFKNSNGKFRQLVEQWQIGQPLGNCFLFFRAYKKMLDVAKKGYYPQDDL